MGDVLGGGGEAQRRRVRIGGHSCGCGGGDGVVAGGGEEAVAGGTVVVAVAKDWQTRCAPGRVEDAGHCGVR